MLLQTLCLFTAALVCTCTGTDPCTNYANLNEPERSTEYELGTTGICDSTITEQWYRSVSGAGSDMPTTAVPLGRCGTQYPIWINDTLPTHNEEKDVKACIVHSIHGNCYETINIKVKNCSDFNVYYLLQTSGCPTAYCFGTELRCKNGKSSETGFTPGCEIVPDMPLSLSVTAGLTDGAHAGGSIYHKVLKFDCNLGSTPDNTNGLIFEVRWYIEDKEVAIFTEKNFTDLPQTSLTEDKWVGKYYMGFNVKCKMRVRYANSSIPGPFYESAFLFAGFKVDKTELTVVENGQQADIQVSLTVPVGCAIDTTFQTTSDCTIRIRVREPKYQQVKCQNGVQTGDDLVFKNLNCFLDFEHDDYTVPKTLSITGKADSLYNFNDRTAYLRLTADQSFIHSAWNYASIPDIKVTVVDKEYELMNKYCSSNNDPYITTFDWMWFSNHRAGEFILYRHNTHPISVQVMYSACPETWRNTATCNCGVAIRNDDAMFIANFCGHITTHNYVSSMPTNRYVEKVSCEDKYMNVVAKGNGYEITLPIGTTVQFTYSEVNERIIIDNIIIKPSMEDIKSSSGLCGYLDNDYRNDLVLRDGSTTTDYSVFAEEWRMKNTSGDISLFASDLNLQKDNVPLRQYCVCGNTTSEIYCELPAAMELCRNTNISQTLAKPYYIRCGEGRPRSKRSLSMYNSHSIYKRSAEDEDSIDKIDLTYDPDYKDQPTEPVWTNGWNAASAEAYCVKEFDANPMVALCKEELPGYEKEIQKIKNECIATIKIAGNTNFVFSSLAALRSSCLSEATRLENLTKSASKSGNDGKTLLDDILDISCVNNCSGNGTCVSGQCECFTGYEGSICNLQKSIPPTISKTSNSWKCKTDQKTCSKYGITGSGFIYGSITCKARHFQIFGDGRHQETGTVLTFAGTYVNEISCSCIFPSSRRRREASSETIIAEGYYMSVSNDGTTFSEEITFINYDSTCYECNVTAVTCSEHNSCVKETTTIESDNVTTSATTDSSPTTIYKFTTQTTTVDTTKIDADSSTTTSTADTDTTVSDTSTATGVDNDTSTTTGVDTTTETTDTTTTFGVDGTSTDADSIVTTSAIMYETTLNTDTTFSKADTTAQTTETTPTDDDTTTTAADVTTDDSDGTTSLSSTATNSQDSETTTSDTSTNSVTSKITSKTERTSLSATTSKATFISFPPTSKTKRNDDISDEEQTNTAMVIAIGIGVLTTAILLVITTVYIIKKKCVKRKTSIGFGTPGSDTEYRYQYRPGSATSFSKAPILDRSTSSMEIWNSQYDDKPLP